VKQEVLSCVRDNEMEDVSARIFYSSTGATIEADILSKRDYKKMESIVSEFSENQEEEKKESKEMTEIIVWIPDWVEKQDPYTFLPNVREVTNYLQTLYPKSELAIKNQKLQLAKGESFNDPWVNSCLDAYLSKINV